MNRLLPIAATLLLAASQLEAPARAWTTETHVEIARQAATIAPPDLFRQIKRNEEAYVAGLSVSMASHAKSSANGKDLLGLIEAGAAATIAAIEDHRPFREIVRHLGRLAVYAADANNPLTHSGADPDESEYRSDYSAYVASAAPRFPVIFYGEGRDVQTPAALRALVEQIRTRGSDLYPLIGREYRRIGAIDGVRLFDDKSTAFGVGSIAYSHAVSDLAAIYRYVWLESGGADWRELPVTRPGAGAQAAGNPASERRPRAGANPGRLGR